MKPNLTATSLFFTLLEMPLPPRMELPSHPATVDAMETLNLPGVEERESGCESWDTLASHHASRVTFIRETDPTKPMRFVDTRIVCQNTLAVQPVQPARRMTRSTVKQKPGFNDPGDVCF